MPNAWIARWNSFVWESVARTCNGMKYEVSCGYCVADPLSERYALCLDKGLLTNFNISSMYVFHAFLLLSNKIIFFQVQVQIQVWCVLLCLVINFIHLPMRDKIVSLALNNPGDYQDIVAEATLEWIRSER